MAKENKIAVFGGGCFWYIEVIFEELNGVISVKSGYAEVLRQLADRHKQLLLMKKSVPGKPAMPK